MGDELISIAMATYNGEQYISEQIDSILCQTFQKFELIISDDCSSDLTWELLNDYVKKDNRVHIYKNEKNLGFKKNFERAISLCSSDYIAFADQDDIWLPNHLEFLYKNIKTKSISGANAVLIDKNGIENGKKLNEVDNFYYFTNDTNFLFRLLLRSDPIQGASMLMNRKFMKKCFPIPDLVEYHDAWFVACACLENGVTYSFDIITKYRQHGNNVTFKHHNKTKNFFQRIKSRLSMLIKGIKTDRFIYVSELKKRYGCQNEVLNTVDAFLCNIKKRKILVKDVVMLWKKFFYITTQNNHKSFFKQLIAWYRWKDYE